VHLEPCPPPWARDLRISYPACLHQSHLPAMTSKGWDGLDLKLLGQGCRGIAPSQRLGGKMVVNVAEPKRYG